MTYKAIKMDYPYDALEPFMPAEFLQMHYEKHHIGYQNKLQSIIEGTEYEDMFENTIDLLKNYQKIEDPILKTKIRELAGGVANHDFF
jgi:Fe-Mn family superoxide dismutase